MLPVLVSPSSRGNGTAKGSRRANKGEKERGEKGMKGEGGGATGGSVKSEPLWSLGTFFSV